MSSIFEGVLDAFKLIGLPSNFKQSFLRACADYAKCHQGQQPQSGTSKSSSTPARIPEISLIFEEVLDAFKLIGFPPNFKQSFLRHVQTMQNVIKDSSLSQEHKKSSQTPAKIPQMSSIFEGVLDAFKLIRFPPNLKQRLT